jgi:hypothetical protein
MGINGTLTVAWYSWISYIKMYGQLFAPAPVDDDRRIDVDTPVVEEFHNCERQDDCNRDQSHCSSKLVPYFYSRGYGCTHETLPCVF